MLDEREVERLHRFDRANGLVGRRVRAVRVDREDRVRAEPLAHASCERAQASHSAMPIAAFVNELACSARSMTATASDG